MKKMKLCRDCKHIVLADYKEEVKRYEYAICGKTVDPVSGVAKDYCCIHRNAKYDVLTDICGSKGKWWELKPKEAEYTDVSNDPSKTTLWNKLKNFFGGKNAN